MWGARWRSRGLTQAPGCGGVFPWSGIQGTKLRGIPVSHLDLQIQLVLKIRENRGRPASDSGLHTHGCALYTTFMCACTHSASAFSLAMWVARETPAWGQANAFLLWTWKINNLKNPGRPGEGDQGCLINYVKWLTCGQRPCPLSCARVTFL